MRDHMHMIHEPMTAATDYLLAAFAICFAVRVWRASRAWSLAFLFTAAAAIVGGTFHAIGPGVAQSTSEMVWLATVLLVGAASASLVATLGGRFAVFGVAKFVVYALRVQNDPSFLVVIADYGLSMLILAVMHVVRPSPARRWILGGIGVSIVAAAIQASGVTLHRHFNHNDLYHLVQIVALWLLHRGAKAGKGRGAQ